ncbi:Glutamate formimidoyltransferase [Thermovirga lienii DSM 17291]|jgi:glutamate formiminotransferase/formiminotetrahydrofolate cyclodeaminase|uniref:Glutamate formimidoyltransferase n=1 Tax=Thermovirga lienii (strain ATCC BAA-1197 / DSM 17291 / Cas60314) TaxID=580340 RepID=G7V774_THELD|nr:cyclodeaminase/cyclohydrolase family protein [Thermovirga lienii]AER66108.1 Glutamate formimidoyltransferase [Thermovirga lienii DSM 17291]MDN5318751.1 methenyltetrahydrofolate cyclohydrolase [Thermovirga sp.]MDN5367695.1 methenyltetrahydrofolate cyclohydrolase [Thermovirga sp.]HCD71831.1 methenyltetrahydrofolate cyclohydrolase [Thermovirga lienii]
MKLAELTVKAFTDELASSSPAPGGGSVAALAASLGSALSSMVGRLTVGKEKYKDNWESMEKVIESGDALKDRFLKLMEEDTEAFNDFMAAMKMPKDTEEQKAARSKAMQEGLKKAVQVPLETLKACKALAEIALTAAEKGNPNAITDAGTAALLAKAAGIAAAYNVRINLGSIKDEAFVSETNQVVKETLDNIFNLADQAGKIVEKALG